MPMPNCPKCKTPMQGGSSWPVAYPIRMPRMRPHRSTKPPAVKPSGPGEFAWGGSPVAPLSCAHATP